MRLLCINTFHLNQINMYCNGLECVSYSVTQVKSQLHKMWLKTFSVWFLTKIVKMVWKGPILEASVTLKSFPIGNVSLVQSRSTPRPLPATTATTITSQKSSLSIISLIRNPYCNSISNSNYTIATTVFTIVTAK